MAGWIVSIWKICAIRNVSHLDITDKAPEKQDNLRDELDDSELGVINQWDQRVTGQDAKLDNINHLLEELKEVESASYTDVLNHPFNCSD